MEKTRNGGGETVQYEWDYRNRLTKVTTTDSQANVSWTSYLYDAFDRRIGKDSGTGTLSTPTHRERYVYDGANVVLSFEGDTSDDLQADDLAHRYLFGPGIGQILADEQLLPGTGSGYDQGQPGQVTWLVADASGSIRDVVQGDAAGNNVSVADHLVYDDFGNVVSQTASGAQPRFTYGGAENGAGRLYLMGARCYDPHTGRFVSEDPAGLGGGDANLYRYVGNSPTNRRDPAGMAGIDNIDAYFAATGAATPNQFANDWSARGEKSMMGE